MKLFVIIGFIVIFIAPAVAVAVSRQSQGLYKLCFILVALVFSWLGYAFYYLTTKYRASSAG